MIRRMVVGSIVLPLFVHATAWACSCAPSGYSTETLLADHDLVVWGEVRSRRAALGGCSGSSLDTVRVRLEVLEGFEGAEAGDIVTVETSSNSASCGVPFEVGERWLVYTNEADPRVSLCGPSELASEGSARLEELRDAITP